MTMPARQLGSESRPRIEEQRVVAARVATEAVVVASAAVEHRVGNVLQPDLHALANGRPQESSLPNGIQSPSITNELLSGFPLRLPLTGAGEYSSGSALPQVYCQPAVDRKCSDKRMRCWR